MQAMNHKPDEMKKRDNIKRDQSGSPVTDQISSKGKATSERDGETEALELVLHNSENGPQVPVNGISHVERAGRYSVMDIRGRSVKKSKSPKIPPFGRIPRRDTDTARLSHCISS
ncbi:Exosome complex component rrp40 [Fusarium oxysporum f. sp. albedinis]|nr:Exosome complex component rrp40 [Fusarium oxysporum f. sp. albedinis]